MITNFIVILSIIGGFLIEYLDPSVTSFEGFIGCMTIFIYSELRKDD